MNTPKELKYTKEHEWINVDNDTATVGITDFAQSELGDIVFIELPNLNDEFNKNDVFGTIEAVKTLADLYIPVSGRIIEINEDLEADPELVNSDPYEKGWIVKIQLKDSSELNDLLSDSEYSELIK
tara:strand:- start:59 stop:436 length:378 start_codon:yes stop_codon:yes gene_type:complete